MKKMGVRIACFVILLGLAAVVLIACGEAKTEEVYYEKAIDISQHQGNIDVTQIDAKLVVVRMGYSGYESGEPNLDAYFLENMKKLSAYEGTIALYWASHSVNLNDVKKENDFIIKTFNALDTEVAERISCIFIDREDSEKTTGRADDLTKDEFNTVLSAQVKGLKKGLDIEVGVYTNVEYLVTMVDYETLGNVPYWIAWYGEDINTTSFEDVINRVAEKSQAAADYLEENIVMWQYSDKGESPVSNNAIDLNVVSSKILK